MSEILREAIRSIVKDEFSEIYGIPCVVDSVDETDLLCDCTPVNGDATFLDVRLQAGTGVGVVMIPKIGSVVMVQPINNQTGYISLYSQIESIKLLNGSYGGLIKIDDIVNKLNTIESDINALKTAFSTWVVVASDGGAALKTITTSWSGQPLTQTQKIDLENALITHGSNK